MFRTREEHGDAVWIVTALDHETHLVEYHRVEPSRYVACVRVECVPAGERTTEVSTAYVFVGLSSEGNAEIAGMTDQAYAEKMRRWERWITAHFKRKSSIEGEC